MLLSLLVDFSVQSNLGTSGLKFMEPRLKAEIFYKGTNVINSIIILITSSLEKKGRLGRRVLVLSQVFLSKKPNLFY